MVAFIAALPAFIAALPYIFQILAQFMGLATRLVEAAEKNGIKKWIEELESSIDLLEKASTPAEKLEAAKRIGAIFKTLG